jgi:hypothetical protein
VFCSSGSGGGSVVMMERFLEFLPFFILWVVIVYFGLCATLTVLNLGEIKELLRDVLRGRQ